MNKLFFFNKNPYSLDNTKKNIFFLKYIEKLNFIHKKKCIPYRKIMNFFKYKKNKKNSLDEMPFIPVNIFKNHDLFSVKKKQIVKTMYSSGTSGLRSKIYLNKENSKDQIDALKTIFHHHFGSNRMPMIILLKKNYLDKNKVFDAKAAAFLGFSMFGKKYFFLYDEDGEIDYKGLNSFLKENNQEKKFIFGFTSDVYEIFAKKININKIKFNIDNSFILHGGGWKNLIKKNVSKKKFLQDISLRSNITKIHNYYGMIEQTGSIFIECKCGFFITTNFSEVLIRDNNLNIIKKPHQKGLVQLLSILPSSYPGHSILTQDIGEIVDRKKCQCKINGKRFLIHGRMKRAEIRGCSDAL